MAGQLRWDGPKVQEQIRKEMGRRLDACGKVVADHAKVLIGREGADRPGKGETKYRYGARRSKPGEPPMTQTGRLKGSVAWERIGLVVRIGTNVFYGRILELFMNRPWLRRALLERANAVRALLGKPVP